MLMGNAHSSSTPSNNSLPSEVATVSAVAENNAAESTTAPSSLVVVAVPGNASTMTASEEIELAETEPSASEAGPSGTSEAGPSTMTECVICLGELGEDGPTERLVCGHQFHSACISEWLDKDGRCPTCRRHIRAVISRNSHMPGTPFAAPSGATRAAMLNMQLLMLDSRRLMMLSTMEALLAVRVAPRGLRLFFPSAVPTLPS